MDNLTDQSDSEESKDLLFGEKSGSRRVKLISDKNIVSKRKTSTSRDSKEVPLRKRSFSVCPVTNVTHSPNTNLVHEGFRKKTSIDKVSLDSEDDDESLEKLLTKSPPDSNHHDNNYDLENIPSITGDDASTPKQFIDLFKKQSSIADNASYQRADISLIHADGACNLLTNSSAVHRNTETTVSKLKSPNLRRLGTISGPYRRSPLLSPKILPNHHYSTVTAAGTGSSRQIQLQNYFTVQASNPRNLPAKLIESELKNQKFFSKSIDGSHMIYYGSSDGRNVKLTSKIIYPSITLQR